MITKRTVPLLVLAFVLTIAPDALAAHCRRCHPVTQACVSAANFGFAICTTGPEFCFLDDPCGSHLQPAPEPLASEFIVASVERLDEPTTAPSETLVASVEAPAPSQANR